MNDAFWNLGLCVVIVGTIALLALLVWAASEVCFKALKSVVGWPWLLRAIRHYAKVERPPRFVVGPDEDAQQSKETTP